MSQLYVAVTLKANASLALVQTGLRNAGFDQKVSRFNEKEIYVLEGNIDSTQVSNLDGLPHVEGVETIREVA